MKKLITSYRAWVVLGLPLALGACKGGGGGGGGNPPSSLTSWPVESGDQLLALADRLRELPVLNWLL